MGPNEWPVSTAVQNVEIPMMSQVSYGLDFRVVSWICSVDGGTFAIKFMVEIFCLNLYFRCMWRPRICMRDKKTFRIPKGEVITDKKGGPRCEKHLFWDADYVCSEYRGRNIVLAELYPSRMMTWTNNTMMRKYPIGKWMMTGCGRWISLGFWNSNENEHGGRERGICQRGNLMSLRGRSKFVRTYFGEDSCNFISTHPTRNELLLKLE